jgi:type II secretory pathway pseudopilin PulG
MRKDFESGFSLVELLISTVVMLIVVGAVFALMKDSIQLATTVYETNEAQESLRVAHEWLSRDLTGVGDGLNSIGNVRLPLTFVTTNFALNPAVDSADKTTALLYVINPDNDVAANTVVPGTNPVVYVRSTPKATDRITFLERDQSFNPIGLPANAIVASGANVSVSAADIGRFQIGEIYFVSSEVGGAFGVVTNVNTNSRNVIFAASDIYGLNQPGNDGPINFVSGKGTLATSLMRMQIVHYFVDSNGLLIRREFGVKGAGYNDSVIAEHVVDLQFRYLLNLRDANGNVVQPLPEPTRPDQLPAISGVEVTITVETTRPIQNGSRQQITMTVVTSVRNMPFRNALQP